MTGIEKVYFQPGETPPFPGYEAWLEDVRRAPIWQAKAPRPYGPDMRDGLGKELFPPPPPRSNLEPEESDYYDRNTAIAAMDFIWETRPDLVWEMMWALQYEDDDPEEHDRLTDECRYDRMYRHAISYHLGKKFPHLDSSGRLHLEWEMQSQIRALTPHLPLAIRRAPWVGIDGLMAE